MAISWKKIKICTSAFNQRMESDSQIAIYEQYLTKNVVTKLGRY
jgi:hypothetical protein